MSARDAQTPVAMAVLEVDSRCTLGEGITWWAARESLLWTDIQSSRLWLHSPGDGSTRSWALPNRLGSLAICASGGLLLGLAKSLPCVCRSGCVSGNERGADGRAGRG